MAEIDRASWTQFSATALVATSLGVLSLRKRMLS